VLSGRAMEILSDRRGEKNNFYSDMRIFAVLFFTVTFSVAGQTPQVPHKMEFAGMKLTIRDDARREIQKDVDALTLSPRHFNIKAERAKTYFPIIEKIFAEEGIPDDFKYLVLQESALIADAVSVSNAVGFWQFKDFTALEMGMRVDKEIDERLNIASSTRGAARYLKKNNTFFDNWLYALQAYQMGAGGVLKSVKEDHHGENHAEITSSTYWYVKKFLAHKIAFEGGVKGKPQIEVVVYENKTRKTLADIANEVSVPETDLRTYNKWAKLGSIPDDRIYTVLVPILSPSTEIAVATVVAANNEQAQANSTNSAIPVTTKPVYGKVNGIQTIQAIAGEGAASLAARAGVELEDFLTWNEITSNHSIIPGAFYLLRKKRSRAAEAYHKVKVGENLWSISQQYGVKLKRLRKFNRLKADVVSSGTTLWLASMKPKSNEKDNVVGNAIEVNHNDTFNWSVNPEEEITVATTMSQPVSTSVDLMLPDSTAMVVNNDSLISNTQVQVIPDTAQQLPLATQNATTTTAAKQQHIVQAKETLYGISKIYNVGVMDLVNWNNLDLQQGIKVGQVLKLSDDQPITRYEKIGNKEITHEVKASDTLFSISRQYGVTIKELMEWNAKKDFSLSVGEKLKVIQVQ
jgi:membrane-bound lytic murein transglycosylase D